MFNTTTLKILAPNDDMYVNEKGENIIFREINGRTVPIATTPDDYAEWLLTQGVQLDPADQDTLWAIQKRLDIISKAGEEGGPGLAKRWEDMFINEMKQKNAITQNYYQQALEAQAAKQGISPADLRQAQADRYNQAMGRTQQQPQPTTPQQEPTGPNLADALLTDDEEESTEPSLADALLTDDEEAAEAIEDKTGITSAHTKPDFKQSLRKDQLPDKGWGSVIQASTDALIKNEGYSPDDGTSGFYEAKALDLVLMLGMEAARRGIPPSDINFKQVLRQEAMNAEGLDRMFEDRYAQYGGENPNEFLLNMYPGILSLHESYNDNPLVRESMDGIFNKLYRRMYDDFHGEEEAKKTTTVDSWFEAGKYFDPEEVPDTLPAHYTKEESGALYNYYHTQTNPLNAAKTIGLHIMNRLWHSIDPRERGQGNVIASLTMTGEPGSGVDSLDNIRKTGYNEMLRQSLQGVAPTQESLVKDMTTLGGEAADGDVEDKLRAIRRISFAMGRIDGLHAAQKAIREGGGGSATFREFAKLEPESNIVSGLPDETYFEMLQSPDWESHGLITNKALGLPASVGAATPEKPAINNRLPETPAKLAEGEIYPGFKLDDSGIFTTPDGYSVEGDGEGELVVFNPAGDEIGRNRFSDEGTPESKIAETFPEISSLIDKNRSLTQDDSAPSAEGASPVQAQPSKLVFSGVELPENEIANLTSIERAVSSTQGASIEDGPAPGTYKIDSGSGVSGFISYNKKLGVLKATWRDAEGNKHSETDMSKIPAALGLSEPSEEVAPVEATPESISAESLPDPQSQQTETEPEGTTPPAEPEDVPDVPGVTKETITPKNVVPSLVSAPELSDVLLTDEADEIPERDEGMIDASDDEPDEDFVMDILGGEDEEPTVGGEEPTEEPIKAAPPKSGKKVKRVEPGVEDFDATSEAVDKQIADDKAKGITHSEDEEFKMREKAATDYASNRTAGIKEEPHVTPQTGEAEEPQVGEAATQAEEAPVAESEKPAVETKTKKGRKAKANPNQPGLFEAPVEPPVEETAPKEQAPEEEQAPEAVTDESKEQDTANADKALSGMNIPDDEQDNARAELERTFAGIRTNSDDTKDIRDAADKAVDAKLAELKKAGITPKAGPGSFVEGYRNNQLARLAREKVESNFSPKPSGPPKFGRDYDTEDMRAADEVIDKKLAEDAANGIRHSGSEIFNMRRNKARDLAQARGYAGQPKPEAKQEEEAQTQVEEVQPTEEEVSRASGMIDKIISEDEARGITRTPEAVSAMKDKMAKTLAGQRTPISPAKVVPKPKPDAATTPTTQPEEPVSTAPEAVAERAAEATKPFVGSKAPKQEPEVVEAPETVAKPTTTDIADAKKMVAKRVKENKKRGVSHSAEKIKEMEQAAAQSIAQQRGNVVAKPEAAPPPPAPVTKPAEAPTPPVASQPTAPSTKTSAKKEAQKSYLQNMITNSPAGSMESRVAQQLLFSKNPSLGRPLTVTPTSKEEADHFVDLAKQNLEYVESNPEKFPAAQQMNRRKRAGQQVVLAMMARDDFSNPEPEQPKKEKKKRIEPKREEPKTEEPPVETEDFGEDFDEGDAEAAINESEDSVEDKIDELSKKPTFEPEKKGPATFTPAALAGEDNVDTSETADAERAAEKAKAILEEAKKAPLPENLQLKEGESLKDYRKRINERRRNRGSGSTKDVALAQAEAASMLNEYNKAAENDPEAQAYTLMTSSNLEAENAKENLKKLNRRGVDEDSEEYQAAKKLADETSVAAAEAKSNYDKNFAAEKTTKKAFTNFIQSFRL